MGGSGSRREARERALALLYEAEVKSTTPAEVVAALPVEPDPYAGTLAVGAGEVQADTDAMIRRLARGWKLERMPAIDRAVLRMAGYELRCQPDVPTGVVIAEAVELASQYSTDDSGRFVNGVLARMAQELRGTPPPIPLPVPTLGDGDIHLRPWEPRDAPVLEQAWNDPEITRWSDVPDDPTVVTARRWIAGTPTLRERGFSLDLVVSDPAGRVLGEVGLTGVAPDGSATIGFWTDAAHRGRGVATRAVRLLTTWAHRQGWSPIVADIDTQNARSQAVARRAGYHQVSGEPRVWVSEVT